MGRKTLFLIILVASRVGFSIDDFSLKWMNHEGGAATFNSAEQLGPVFVIEAYFQTCPHCNVNAPAVDSLAAKYKSNSRVQVLDVGIDRTDSSYQTWISEHNPNHPVLNDSTRALIKQLGTTGYPSTYVINCRGKIIYDTSGEWDSSARTEIQNAIETALDAPCPL